MQTRAAQAPSTSQRAGIPIHFTSSEWLKAHHGHCTDSAELGRGPLTDAHSSATLLPSHCHGQEENGYLHTATASLGRCALGPKSITEFSLTGFSFLHLAFPPRVLRRLVAVPWACAGSLYHPTFSLSVNYPKRKQTAFLKLGFSQNPTKYQPWH